MRGIVSGLESEIQAERKAQRDLKLVLAAAEQQAQHDSNERREVALRCESDCSPLLSFAGEAHSMHDSMRPCWLLQSLRWLLAAGLMMYVASISCV